MCYVVRENLLDLREASANHWLAVSLYTQAEMRARAEARANSVFAFEIGIHVFLVIDWEFIAYETCHGQEGNNKIMGSEAIEHLSLR